MERLYQRKEVDRLGWPEPFGYLRGPGAGAADRARAGRAEGFGGRAHFWQTPKI